MSGLADFSLVEEVGARFDSLLESAVYILDRSFVPR